MPKAAQPQTATTAQVTFTMHWSSTTASTQRKPAYVPATALSVSVTVNGGQTQVLNAPATTLAIDAPVGTDLFTFQTYDEPNGQGNVLSRAAISKTIVDGAANTISAVLNGVVAALGLSVNATFPAGTTGSFAISASAKDADGNTIVGPGDYSVPITLAITDPANSGTLALSTNSVAGPGSPANLLYNGGTLASATLTASATGVPPVSVTITPTPTFRQFSLPSSVNYPEDIAAGSDGNMWFTEFLGSRIGKITPAGVVTEYTIPTANSGPTGIIAASDGRLWFAESAAGKIGAVTTSGTFTEYPTLYNGDAPEMLVDRGDGTVWFTAENGNRVGYVTFSGGVGETTLPNAFSAPYGITTAPDNNVYFTELDAGSNRIGRINNNGGTINELSLPNSPNPEQIVRGPDGTLWFTEYNGSAIGQLQPTGFYVENEFPTLTPNAGPWGITVGADGALWFTEQGVDKIGRITTSGQVTEYASPVTGLNLLGIAAARNGTLWFTEPTMNDVSGHIGELIY